MPLLDIKKTQAKINAGSVTPSVTTGASKVNVTTPVTTPTNTASVTPKKSTPLKAIPTKAKPVDTFWAVSWKSTLGQTVTPWARLSTGQTVSKDTAKASDLGNLNVWWSAAKWAETVTPWTIVKRNDTVVQNLLSQWVTDQAGIKSYLEQQEWFTGATPEEQANTLRALTEQMGITPWATASPTDSLTEKPKDETQDLVWLARAKEQAELVTKTKEDLQFKKDMRAKELEIKNLEGETIKIQSSQRIQNAQDQLDSLKQRYAYLWSQWQPWVSSVQLESVGKQLTQAEQTFWQLKQMEQNAAQMRELGIKYDAEAFEKEIDDIQYKLDQQVSKAVQDKVNEFNTIAWWVDTLEELEKVKGTMMQELDKSIANIAISNQADRQLILDRYNEVIKTSEEFVKNKNTVNKEMSTALWYYVDGNGSPIMNSQWLPIQMPVEPPMKPIFQDWQLITFSTGANGEIVANPQQILQAKQNPRQKWEDGSFYRTNAQWEIEFANAPWVSGWVSTSYQWPTIPAVDPATVQSKLQPVLATKDGSKVWDGRCGAFVNNYTQSLGLGRMFIDPIDIRKTQTNSDVPTIWSVAIFDYGNNPNVSQAAQKYGHVAIVQSVNNDWTITIKEQNGNNKMAVGTRTVPANKVYWYFDPTKWLQQWSETPNKPYDPSMLSTYTKFIETWQKPTEKQIAELWWIEKFTSDANKAYLDVQNRILNAQNMKLTDPEFYVSMSPDERKEFAKDSKTVKNVVSKVDSIIKKVQDSGLPRQTLVWKWGALKWEITDLQMQMKWEWAYALWVLTWPDLALLESVIPSPDLVNKAWGEEQFINRLIQARDMFTNQINTNNAWLWVTFNPPPSPVSWSDKATSLLWDMVNIVTKTGTTTPIKIWNVSGKVR